MYRNAYQRGMLTVFFSVGSKPLNIWETHTQDGYITRFLDQDIKSMVLEIGGTNVSTTYMTCPKGNQVLGITMPFLVMIVKNLKKYFTFEVTILDETGTRRRFRVSNFQSNTQILPLCTVMPIGLSDGWNQIQFNLAEFTRRAYKKQYVEVQKLKINANIRLRRIYFTERLVPEDQLPPEYKLFFPLSSKKAIERKKKEAVDEDKKEIQKTVSKIATQAEEKVQVEGTKPDVTDSKTKVLKTESKSSLKSIPKAASKQNSVQSHVSVQIIEQVSSKLISKSVSKVYSEKISKDETSLDGEKTSVISIPATTATDIAENEFELQGEQLTEDTSTRHRSQKSVSELVSDQESSRKENEDINSLKDDNVTE